MIILTFDGAWCGNEFHADVLLIFFLIHFYHYVYLSILYYVLFCLLYLTSEMQPVIISIYVSFQVAGNTPTKETRIKTTIKDFVFWICNTKCVTGNNNTYIH